MYEAIGITAKKATTFQIEEESQCLDLTLGNSRLGLGIIKVAGAFVGILGIICLINGLANCNDLHELSRGLVVALTGM